MKVKIFNITVILLVLAVGIACHKEEYPKEEDGRFKINKNEYVSMRLSPNTAFIGSSAVLIIENHTKKEIDYGNEFLIEYFDEGNWTEIPLNCMFSDILYMLYAGKTHEIQFGILSDEYFYRLGKYRIIKHFSVPAGFILDSDNILYGFDLTAEIEIK
jgi:hypothetical protein